MDPVPLHEIALAIFKGRNPYAHDIRWGADRDMWPDIAKGPLQLEIVVHGGDTSFDALSPRMGIGLIQGMALTALRGRMAPSGARPSTGPEKRSAPRAGQRLAGAVARRWRPPARSLRGCDRRYSARVSLVSVEVVVLGAGERATRERYRQSAALPA